MTDIGPITRAKLKEVIEIMGRIEFKDITLDQVTHIINQYFPVPSYDIEYGFLEVLHNICEQASRKYGENISESLWEKEPGLRHLVYMHKTDYEYTVSFPIHVVKGQYISESTRAKLRTDFSDIELLRRVRYLAKKVLNNAIRLYLVLNKPQSDHGCSFDIVWLGQDEIPDNVVICNGKTACEMIRGTESLHHSPFNSYNGPFIEKR